MACTSKTCIYFNVIFSEKYDRIGKKSLSYGTLFSLNNNISTLQLSVKMQQFINFTRKNIKIQGDLLEYWDLTPSLSPPHHNTKKYKGMSQNLERKKIEIWRLKYHFFVRFTTKPGLWTKLTSLFMSAIALLKWKVYVKLIAGKLQWLLQC